MVKRVLDFPRSAGLVCGGLLVWLVLFLASYMGAGVACAHGYSYALWLGLGVVPLFLAGGAVLALVVLLRLARRADRLQSESGVARRNDDTRRVVAHVATTVCGLALVAIFWHALAALLTLSRC